MEPGAEPPRTWGRVVCDYQRVPPEDYQLRVDRSEQRARLRASAPHRLWLALVVAILSGHSGIWAVVQWVRGWLGW